jgi:hypothetical protein
MTGILLGILGLAIVGFIIVRTDHRFWSNKARYREKNGLLQYKGEVGWENVRVWSKEEKERSVKITDCIRGRVFEKKYTGYGVEHVPYSQENLEYYKKNYPTYKDITLNQEDIIDTENDYLKFTI